MVRYQVTCECLRIRTGPSTSSRQVGQYYRGDIINSGDEPFEGEDGRTWISYSGGQTGVTRFVCYDDRDN